MGEGIHVLGDGDCRRAAAQLGMKFEASSPKEEGDGMVLTQGCYLFRGIVFFNDDQFLNHEDIRPICRRGIYIL